MTCFLPLYRKVTKSTVAKQMDVAFTQVKGPWRSKNSCKVKWQSVDSMMCGRILVHDKNVPKELSTVVINPGLIGINPHASTNEDIVQSGNNTVSGKSEHAASSG